VAITAASLAISPVYADQTGGNLKYTTFSGGQNVWSIDFLYDGVATIGFLNDVNLCSTQGADGIAGNPQNVDLLLVGGQNNGQINTCSISTGVATSFASPTNVFHLEVPTATTVFGNGIPGQLISHTINPDGSLVVPGTAYTLSTAGGCTGDTVITQLITTPVGTFYANDGIFGTLTFTGATTADTCRLYGAGGLNSVTPLQGAHGGVYDPFSNTILTMGNSCVSQLTAAGVLISNTCFAGGGFDQGTVDGQGHAFIAQNPNIFFLDYQSTGLIASATFSTSTNVRSSLDDVAPLVGMGSTDPCVLNPTLPQCNPVGGEFLPIDSTALILAGAQSFSWMIPVVLSVLGIGLFVVSRKSENS